MIRTMICLVGLGDIFVRNAFPFLRSLVHLTWFGALRFVLSVQRLAKGDGELLVVQHHLALF